MTNKEILAQLKKSYEYLTDIRENGCADHCNGQLEMGIDKLDQAISNLEDIYGDFCNSLNEDLVISGKLNFFEDDTKNIRKILIDKDISGGYEIVLNNGDSEYVTCEDVEYKWYEDEDFLTKLLKKDNFEL